MKKPGQADAPYIKRKMRQIVYDATHRATCMCDNCNNVVENNGAHWTYLLGGLIVITDYYFPDRCPHCGD